MSSTCRTATPGRSGVENGIHRTTLAELGMDISLAKIATEKNQALDVFYVSNAEGSPLSPGEEAAVRRALMEALTRDG